MVFPVFLVCLVTVQSPHHGINDPIYAALLGTVFVFLGPFSVMLLEWPHISLLAVGLMLLLIATIVVSVWNRNIRYIGIFFRLIGHLAILAWLLIGFSVFYVLL